MMLQFSLAKSLKVIKKANVISDPPEGTSRSYLQEVTSTMARLRCPASKQEG